MAICAIEGLETAGDEDCLLGVCFILGVPHHIQFLRVHDAPDPDNAARTLQAAVDDPYDRYADLQTLYPARDYVTVDLSEFGFEGRYVVLVHPFEA